MAGNTDVLIKELDALNEADKFDEIYDKLKRPDGNYENMDPQLMWRFARTIRFLVLTKGHKDKKARDAWIREGVDVMKTAVEKHPDDCLSNTWYGIMLNVESQIESMKKKIQLGYQIREYFDKGYKANPKEYITLHCLGSWCFEVASLNKAERLIATAFFGKPPNSSFDEALKFYLEAENAEPDHPYTVCRIAQCYDRLGKKEQAKEWAQKAIKLHAQDSEVEELQKECRRLAG